MEPKTPSRRRHSAELKAQILMQCAQPGASIAAIAQTHGLNANLVHKWRRHAKRIAASTVLPGAEFIALSIASAPMPAPIADIRIDLRRGATIMTINWPVAAAGDCAAWIRELLR